MVQATILFNCQRHLLNGVLQLPFKEQLHFPAKPNYKVLKRSSMCRRRDYIGFCRWTLARKFQPPYMRHCFSPRANYVNGFKVQWRCILIGVEAWLENENVAGGRTHIRPVPGVMLTSWTVVYQLPGNAGASEQLAYSRMRLLRLIPLKFMLVASIWSLRYFAVVPPYYVLPSSHFFYLVLNSHCFPPLRKCVEHLPSSFV